MARAWDYIFPLGDNPDYEPDPSTSIGARARARGVKPMEEAYDRLLDDDGRAMLLVATSNLENNSLNTVGELLHREDVVLGLGDGGAHYGMICDASYATYFLAHWARDRKSGRFTVPEAVRELTSVPARVAEGQGGVGPAGEAVRRAEQPLPQRLGVGCLPVPGGVSFEGLDFRIRHSRAARCRGRGGSGRSPGGTAPSVPWAVIRRPPPSATRRSASSPSSASRCSAVTGGTGSSMTTPIRPGTCSMRKVSSRSPGRPASSPGFAGGPVSGWSGGRVEE